jgi:hypothetical protein
MPQLESEPGEALTGSSASFEPMPEAPELDESPELESMPPGGYTTEAEPFEAPEEPAPEGPPLELEPPGGYVAEVEPPETGLPGLETDEPALDAADSDLGAAAREADEALSELTDSADEPSLPGLEAPAVGGVSPEDLVSEDTAPEWSEDLPIDAEIASPGEEPPTAAEDLVEVPTPSWDDVADSCLALAPAHGAMLVDPSGQVLTARGEWPEPGPEAIAGRLVSMMEKKLRDAPTRSVSAPLAGQHLTAWRVPADEGYLTIVFMAAAPLRADVRPAIDTAIQASGA